MEVITQATDSHLLQINKIESLSLLAGGLAHDFNNLLMTILGNVDLALSVDEPPSAEVRGFLREIQGASERAAELCSGLLAYSGRGRLPLRVVELNLLIEGSRELLELSAGEGVALATRARGGLPPVRGDAEELRRLLVHLVRNGGEATHGRGGHVHVLIGPAEADDPWITSAVGAPLDSGRDYVLVEVADDGAGMDEATSLRIFDPFFTTKGAGRGLGLARVFGVVRTHAGRIHVDSAPGAGTRVRVYLPVLS
jgi:signal transduction histidine kinase